MPTFGAYPDASGTWSIDSQVWCSTRAMEDSKYLVHAREPWL
jgi:hypothetical protein